MIPDPTAEIKRIRHELGAADDFDVAKIFARLRRAEAESGRTYFRRSPRRPSNNKGVQKNREAGQSFS
ncbi:MAG: hypothetical protein AAF939_19710 [Planctomycetota bacterium]